MVLAFRAPRDPTLGCALRHLDTLAAPGSEGGGDRGARARATASVRLTAVVTRRGSDDLTNPG